MKNRTKWVAIFMIATIGAIGIWRGFLKKEKVNLWTELRAQKRSLQVMVQSSGTILPENRVEIKSAIAGRIDKVIVQEGLKVAKGQVLAWMSSTERAVLLDSARAQGESELARWEDLYKPTAIIAPVSGMIILRNVESGQTISSSDVILVMSDRLIVKAQVDETDLARISKGQRAEVVLDAYSKTPIEATVEKIAFEAKTVNNVTTYSIVLVPKKTPEYMRSGMTANIRFLLAQADNVWTLPVEALDLQEGQPRVRIAVKGDPQKAFVLKKVETGITDGKYIEIKSGLDDQETILSEVFSADSLKPKDQPKSFFSNIGSGRGGRR